MAEIHLNPVIEGISSQVGELVFFTRQGKTFIRRKVIPANPNTLEQQKSRNAFREVARRWQELSDENKTAWKDLVRGGRYSGYNAFMKANINRFKAGDEIVIVP